MWPARSNWDAYVYGFFMIPAWCALTEAVLGTLGIVAHIRRNQPLRAEPPQQSPHGGPGEERGSREPETI